MTTETDATDLLCLSKDEQTLLLRFDHLKGSGYSEEDVLKFIRKSEYANFKIDTGSLTDAVQCAEVKDDESTPVAYRKDAEFSLHIDPLQIEVQAKLTSAFAGKSITSEQIYDRLKELNVTTGIIDKAINLIVQKSNDAEPGTRYTIMVAKGEMEQDGQDTSFQPLVESSKMNLIDALTEAKEEFELTSLEQLITVHAGTALMRVVPSVEGKEGFTVTGDTIPYKSGTDLPIELGENTKFSDDDPNLIIASRSGSPTITNNIVSIDPVLMVDKASASSDPICHKGNLIITGDLTAGDKVVATGDITVLGFIESAIVKCGGDLFVSNGIIGEQTDEENSKFTCKVKCEGSLFTSFIQYATLFVTKDLNVQRQIIHSNISCEGYATVQDKSGKRGAIFGGILNAKDGVSTVNLGATSGVKTVINLSSAYSRIFNYKTSLQTSLDKIEAVLSKSCDTQNKLKQSDPPEEPEKLTELHQMTARLKESIDSYKEKKLKIISQMQFSQDEINKYMNKTQAQVTNTVFNNVTVKIGHHLFQSKKQRFKTVSICVKSGNIIADKHQK